MPKHSRGFTLVEMVVALTLTAILLVIVYSGLSTGIRAQQGIAETAEHNDAERTLTHFLRRQLRHAAVDVPDSLRFRGEPRGLQFALRGFRGDPWLYRLRLDALPADDPRRLAVSVQRVDSDGATGASALYADLLRDARALHLAFFGRLGHETEAAWHEYWDGERHPPQLVRLRYVLGDGRAATLYLSVAGGDGNQVAAYESPGRPGR